MSNIASYRRLNDTLRGSLEAFDQADIFFTSPSPENGEQNETNEALKARWFNTLTQGSALSAFVKDHYRAQSPQVLAALEELAKYSNVSRPFRLSVIGQKGVGKSALVNALLGASTVQYTPSEVAGKAVSGTRIRLIAYRAEEQPGIWQVVFLTPARLWEIGSYLLHVARLNLPQPPADLNNREQVVKTLKASLNSDETGEDESLQTGSTMQIQAANARDTLAAMLEVYQRQAANLPEGYRLWLDEADVDGAISPYIRQTETNTYLIVDYVERYLPAGEGGGLLAGRPLELEDVLGLDDPRDSFFALEAFKEAFAVIMVFKCDRGLNTESRSLLEQLFSRDEADLARFGQYADLNKAIVVANQFDSVTGNIAAGTTSNPLKGIEDIRRELNRYSHQQNVPIYLTSAQMAQNSQAILSGNTNRPSAAYSAYLESLSNLLQVVSDRGTAPDYLDFILSRRAEIEAGAFDQSSFQFNRRAELILELSGLPRLKAKVQEALEASSILRGRVANAEYYYSRALSETALCYARQMSGYNLSLNEFDQTASTLESRLFSKFQYEIRQKLDNLDQELKRNYFVLAQRHIHGPMPTEAEQARQRLLDTIRQVLLSNRQLIQMQQHISTGETVTDAWRKVFEDINDWLALETGRQLRSLVGPLLGEIEKLAVGMQKELTTLAATPLDEIFWENFQSALARLRQRLLTSAEILAIGYYTDNRFSVYDLQIAEALHVGEAVKRREAVIKLMQMRVQGWYNNLWHLLAKVVMTDLSAFVAEIRHRVLGLPADGGLLVGYELAGNGEGFLAPEASLIAILNQRYHTSETYRQQYAMREPTPAERLVAEIRDWLTLAQPPLDGLGELGKAVAIVGTSRPDTDGEGEQAGGLPFFDSSSNSDEEAEAAETNNVGRWPESGSKETNNISISNQEPQANSQNQIETEVYPLINRLRFPIESRHPYNQITRQTWEITNPDQQARFTRLHFSRIDLGQSQNNSDRINLRALGQQQQRQQIISGQHTDFWSQPFPGRTVVINFTADNVNPGWGFVLDAVETVTSTPKVESSYR